MKVAAIWARVSTSDQRELSLDGQVERCRAKLETLRCFIALELPPEVREELARLQAGLRGAGGSGVRWVAPEGIHLTLKFLGSVPRETLPGVEGTIREAARGEAPFELHLGRLGFFPSPSRARVFWVAVEGEVGVVHRIAQRLEQALLPLGFAKAERPFTPHLTLARLREGLAPAQHQAFGQAALNYPWSGGHPFRVAAIALMRSQLTPQGAIYSRLSQVALVGGN